MGSSTATVVSHCHPTIWWPVRARARSLTAGKCSEITEQTHCSGQFDRRHASPVGAAAERSLRSDPNIRRASEHPAPRSGSRSLVQAGTRLSGVTLRVRTRRWADVVVSVSRMEPADQRARCSMIASTTVSIEAVAPWRELGRRRRLGRTIELRSSGRRCERHVARG